MQALHLEHGGRHLLFHLLGGEDDLPADHQAGKRGLVHLLGADAAGDLPVFEDGDVVGDLHDLL